MIPTEKQQVLEKHFYAIEDKGTFISCTMTGQTRVWMYDKKLINLFSTEKLEKLISNQVLK